MQILTLGKTITARDFLFVVLASLALGLFGRISIPLWFTPVPIATQNTAVLLVAALLGSRRGVAAVFAFLAQGAMGLPVFSNGAAGFAHFFGPTGSYLIGYLVAAFVVGLIAEKRKTIGGFTLALAAGNATIYLFGVCGLSFFVGFNKAFQLGVVPFLIGDFVKSLIVVKILHWKSNWSVRA